MSIFLSRIKGQEELGIGVIIHERKKVSYQLNLRGWLSFTKDLLADIWDNIWLALKVK